MRSEPVADTSTKAPPATTATTIAPTTTAPCNANYSKCLRGNGPFTCIGDTDDPDFKPAQPGATAVSGPFNVTGSDPFDLDVDGNGELSHLEFLRGIRCVYNII